MSNSVGAIGGRGVAHTDTRVSAQKPCFMRFICALSFLAAAVTMAGCDRNERRMSQCEEGSLSACTDLIESKKFQGAVLAKLYVLRGRQFYEQGLHISAHKDLTLAIDHAQNDRSMIAALKLRAHVSTMAGETQRALDDIDRGLKMDGEVAMLHELRALALLHQWELKGTAEALATAVDLGGETPMTYFIRGYLRILLVEQRAPNLAALKLGNSNFRNAAGLLFPGSGAAGSKGILVDDRILSEHTARALSVFNGAVDEDTGIEALLARGHFHFMRDDIEAAAKDFRSVLERRPDHPEAFDMLALTSLEVEAEANNAQ